MVRGAGARKSIGQAYGALQEVEELREQAAQLADRNRELAKALNASKMELTRVRSSKTDTVAQKLAQWASEKYGRKQVYERGTQCDLDDEDEPEPVCSPTRRVKKKPRLQSPFISTCMPEQGARGAYNSHERAGNDRFDSDFSVETFSSISEENELSSRASLASEERSPHVEQQTQQSGRFRGEDASYTTSRLHAKARKAPTCGLGKRSRPSNASKPRSRKHQGSPTSQSFVVTIYSPPTPGARPRRVTRRLQRISYVEPKINTKLRQGDKFTFTT